jgi:plastocyanin
MILIARVVVALVAWLPAAVIASSLTIAVTDGEGRPLANAVITLYAGDDRPSPEAVPEAVMDQRDRQFVPQVLAVRTGTVVRFPNSDNIRHHVYSFSPAKRFELRLYHGTTAEPVQFDQPGKVALGCNIHDAMIGYIYVVDSEWFGVTGPEGQWTFDALPEGELEVQIQHPRLADPLTRALTITGTSRNETIALDGLQPDPRQQAPESDLERLFDR